MKLSGKAIVCGVIGWPISHSCSPILHNFWLKKYNIDGAYVPFPIKPDQLDKAILGILNLGIKGINVTLPHKESVLNYIHDLTDEAENIGAVNTLTVNEVGEIYGDNTDPFGFIENIRTNAPNVNFSSKKAIVIGAGGASRSVCFALIKAGISEIVLTNRSKERGDLLRKKFGSVIAVEPWKHRSSILEEADIVINCTSLGMYGQPDLDISLGKLPQHAVVNDLVYAPIDTNLIREAERRGHICIDGLGMLLYQAQPSFYKWFNIEPEVSAQLRNHVIESLN